MQFHRENATFAYLQGLVQRSPALSSVSNHKPKGKNRSYFKGTYVCLRRLAFRWIFVVYVQLWSPLSYKIDCSL